MELRFFEIYRRPDYLLLLLEGAAFSAFLTVAAAVMGLMLALALSGARYAKVPVFQHIATGCCG